MHRASSVKDSAKPAAPSDAGNRPAVPIHLVPPHAADGLASSTAPASSPAPSADTNHATADHAADPSSRAADSGTTKPAHRDDSSREERPRVRLTAAPPPQPMPEAELRARLEELATLGRGAGMRVETIGVRDGWPLLAMTRRAGPAAGNSGGGGAVASGSMRNPAAALRSRPRIYLSAGIHGDEAAPIETIRVLLRDGLCDPRVHWAVCPLLSPTSHLRGTRENADGLDLNRDYRHAQAPETRAHRAWLQRQPRFDLALCLHEDWEALGFYFYELDQTGASSLAPAVLAAAARHSPLEDAALIDERPTKGPGLIHVTTDPAERELWPEAIYLLAEHTRRCFTIETASVQPLAQRVATQVAVVRATVDALLGAVE